MLGPPSALTLGTAEGAAPAEGVGGAAAPARQQQQGPTEQRPPSPQDCRLVEGLGAAPLMVATRGAAAAVAFSGFRNLDVVL